MLVKILCKAQEIPTHPLPTKNYLSPNSAEVEKCRSKSMSRDYQWLLPAGLQLSGEGPQGSFAHSLSHLVSLQGSLQVVVTWAAASTSVELRIAFQVSQGHKTPKCQVILNRYFLKYMTYANVYNAFWGLFFFQKGFWNVFIFMTDRTCRTFWQYCFC